MNKCTKLAMCLAAAAFAAAPAVGQTIISPENAASKDTFVYSFLPSFNFNAMAGFDVILASGKSASGHDLRSLVQFDLAGVTMAPGDIATLNLFVADGGTVGFPVVNPSPAFPVTADVYPVTSAWTVGSVNWTTQPTVGATILNSQVIDGIGRYVSFNVTDQVAAWLADPASNFGFSVQQRDVVANGGSVQAIYHSAAGANRPYLYVGAVPEPAGALVLAAGLLISRKRKI